MQLLEYKIVEGASGQVNSAVSALFQETLPADEFWTMESSPKFFPNVRQLDSQVSHVYCVQTMIKVRRGSEDALDISNHQDVQ